MSDNDFDLLIIGSGPAGQHAALHAARMGKRAGIIERKPRIGGAGLQTGTIPSKALREVAFLASRSGRRGMRGAFGGGVLRPHGLLAEAIRQKEMVIAQQESVILNRLMRSGVALIPGDACFAGPHALDVTTPNGEVRRLSADVIVLATGSRPRRPADVPFDRKAVLDSTSILKLRHLPGSMTVVGGGVIACEFTCIFAALGVEVSVMDSHAQVLSYLSEDVVSALTDAMQSMGVQFRMNSRAAAIRKQDGQVVVTLQDGGEIVSDALLYAQGREPNSSTLMLEHAGVDVDAGWIGVNEFFQSNVPHIYAVGDLIGRPALAATGMEQGRIAVMHAFGEKTPHMVDNMPMAIYTIPEISYVGKTEKELRAEGVDYVVGRGRFSDSARGQIIGEETGLLKLNVERATRKILGVHIVGESASELIHIGQLVMNLGGTVTDLVRNVFNYPTLAECYKLAALDCLAVLHREPAEHAEKQVAALQE
ncbi:MAG: Si-specific NAD(P)(+) transhydrogenase [Zetaproteobacteria bacterium CG06_land_8_20_14_3_00_59_53]|nr:MAG: NAD(P)(+) transhydrogenase [Zetaproteobacteria bacterium CG2_30_59_37]PIO90269.1 MAG: Si-specific NAD(P)(+) transhydrogenase [Zetaproteobacteria bacterium CG23_combo_of_CG06-09_8_20_14_all_59_86]PIQ64615.1 MAG: Si-specific NAD(P)(+) transhydrogenase [Zetaproteobacteria bacterium CG11_big_fil_rev_8_21_14_0_20_59_439]PIU71315.1 MAG: Si-specific NAD(P)(+) transhydrogenase [Zetaproteobacteria bacterium CG06_land_8_20_14_3_00_59_53]PIU97251.1 MAG: Si-specific NAD(P)(+) transhydrogenase [Zeta